MDLVNYKSDKHSDSTTVLQYGVRILIKSECRRKKLVYFFFVFSVSAETPESSICSNIDFFVQSLM